LVGLVLPAALADTTTKPVLVTVSPASVSAGATVDLRIDITNEANPQSLGSANLTPPAGISVSDLALSAPGDLSVSGSTIQLRDLNLAPNGTITITGSLTAACGSVGGDWIVKIKQSNNFNGPPGNDFILDLQAPDVSSITTTVSGSCYLAFDTQPATAVKNDHITSVPGDESGTDVQVSAYSGVPPTGTLMTSFDGYVTLAIGPGSPSGGTLSPATVTTTGVQAVNGTATFSQANLGAKLSLDVSNEGYTLQAAATGFSPVSSDPFDIVDVYVDCSLDPSCSASLDNNSGTSGEIDTTDASFLSASILAPGAIDCTGYLEITGTISWKTDDTGDQIGTIVADGSLIKKSLRPPDQGASHFQVCFKADTGKTFIPRGGGDLTSGPALLPDCSSTITTNCVFFRNKTQAGSAVVQFRVADGKGRI
jgi:hypothetical protein